MRRTNGNPADSGRSLPDSYLQQGLCVAYAPTWSHMPAPLGLESEAGGWAVTDSGDMVRVLTELEHP
jgi:hypothetical protein